MHGALGEGRAFRVSFAFAGVKKHINWWIFLFKAVFFLGCFLVVFCFLIAFCTLVVFLVNVFFFFLCVCVFLFKMPFD